MRQWSSPADVTGHHARVHEWSDAAGVPALRGRRGAILTALLIALSTFVAGPLGGAGASVTEKAPRSAKQLSEAALRAASDVGTVHAVSHITSGSIDQTFVQDVGLHEGQRSVTRPDGTAAEIRYTGDVVYLQGNHAGLVEYFGYPADVATTFTDRWVSITAADPPHAQISTGVTMPALEATIALTGKLRTRPAETRHGTRVIPIVGTFDHDGGRGRGTLYVSTGARPLPTEFVGSVGDLHLTATFSKWGEPFTVEAPTDATPYAQLASAR